VPKFNGGLYSADDGVNDHRCVYKGGKCYNEVRKLKIKDKIQQILLSDKVKELSVQLTQEQAEKVAGIIYEGTPVSSIIEYSRSIH
ncbi:cytidine deaminase, partial [Escherichia coli]|nr:cytidine deaminase [Escherichia coli]